MIKSELYDLAHAGDVSGVTTWLDLRPEDLNGDASEGFTVLHVACMFGYEDMVRRLLGRGALVNVNAMNASRATPLHLAVSHRDENVADRIARILIACGAELNGAQAGGQTSLHHAVARGSVKLVETLVESGADPFLEDDQGRSPSDLAKAFGGEGADRAVDKNETANRMREILKRAFTQ